MAHRREEAFSRYASASLPTGEEEIWRYSRIGDLHLDRFSPAGGVPAAQHGLPEMPAPALALVDRVGERSGFVLDVGGRIAEADLGEEAEQAGVRLSRASGLGGAEGLVGSVRAAFGDGESGDSLDDLAEAFSDEPVVVSIPAGVELSHPIVVVHLLALDHEDPVSGPAFFPRLALEVGESARATVVELALSGPGAVLVAPATELSVGDGARLSYSSIQQLGRRTWQLGHSWARAGRDAELVAFTASLGGEYARSRTDSILDGPGGSAQLLAAFLGDGSQTHDFRTLQEHVAPRTTSDLLFKGAVGGSARSVYSGLIRMRRGSRGANAFQTNRNLVLSEGAHADSVPNLDIQENDVRCSHASAVGPIDPEQRFYLESRGVPSAVAERLILVGFFTELLERAEPAVRDHVVAELRGRLHGLTETGAP